jgi:hypothetical protein
MSPCSSCSSSASASHSHAKISKKPAWSKRLFEYIVYIKFVNNTKGQFKFKFLAYPELFSGTINNPKYLPVHPDINVYKQKYQEALGKFMIRRFGGLPNSNGKTTTYPPPIESTQTVSSESSPPCAAGYKCCSCCGSGQSGTKAKYCVSSNDKCPTTNQGCCDPAAQWMYSKCGGCSSST